MGFLPMAGPAIPLPTGSPGIPPVIEGGGYVNDNNDSTYVDCVMRVWGHFASGQDRFELTPAYTWDFTPDSSAPPYAETDYYLARVQAKVELVSKQIEYHPTSTQTFGFHYIRISDGLVLTDVASLSLFGPSSTPLEVGVPTWVTAERDQNSGVVVGGKYEALRTGVFPTYGPVRLGFGFSGQPGFTPHNDVGDENRLRLYEYRVTFRPGGPQVGEGLISL